MARKLFVLVAIVAVVALAYAEEEKKEEKKDDVEGRIGFGGGFGQQSGGNQYGFNRGQSGFNQGSGGFDSANPLQQRAGLQKPRRLPHQPGLRPELLQPLRIWWWRLQHWLQPWCWRCLQPVRVSGRRLPWLS
ncbi:hypothetical protein MTO96_047804 [Rhipicephalus appendiculatus]